MEGLHFLWLLYNICLKKIYSEQNKTIKMLKLSGTQFYQMRRADTNFATKMLDSESSEVIADGILPMRTQVLRGLSTSLHTILLRKGRLYR